LLNFDDDIRFALRFKLNEGALLPFAQTKVTAEPRFALTSVSAMIAWP
jgi:hypothetical protein